MFSKVELFWNDTRNREKNDGASEVFAEYTQKGRTKKRYQIIFLPSITGKSLWKVAEPREQSDGN